MKIFKNIPKFGYQHDLVSFNNIIWSLGNAGKKEECESLFQTLLQNSTRLHPNVYTFGALAHAYSRIVDPEGAFSLIDRMKMLGISPNKIVLTSILDTCSYSKNYSYTKKILTIMDEMGINPDEMMFDSLIRACARADKMDEALFYFE